ncbi:MAG: HYR domain-containing protein [Sulfuriflexus sp.]|nr:HYR domain-containing protein [Sulfuriflexus sp.]
MCIRNIFSTPKLWNVFIVILVMSMSTPVHANEADNLSGCGADGQRACCAGTFEVTAGSACDTGAAEVPGCTGDCLCGGANIFGVNALGSCKTVTPCGGENQRACTLLEGAQCQKGLVSIEGCAGGDNECLGTALSLSEHTCVKPTACGGKGQRACCVTEGRACQAGLDESPGCTGDCICGGGKSNSSCVVIEKIAEPDTNWVAPGSGRGRTCPLQGYADIHMHLNAHLAHGGKLFAGQPAPTNVFGKFTFDNDYNINTALSSSNDRAIHQGNHGLIGDIIGDGTNDGSTSNNGAPAFNSWPTWTSTTHQQLYYKWLERAYRGGLRLTVMMAVTNEALCKSTGGTDCANSMGPIDAQLDAAYDFETFIDTQNGGPGKGWFRIVTAPTQARQVIADGKLAVILGIEVDNLFNCKEENHNRLNASCPNMRDSTGALIKNEAGETIDTIDKAVAYYYDKGVRHVFPVHNFDNAFGAAATWQDAVAAGNAYSEQRWWKVEDCGTGNGNYGYWIDNILSSFLNTFGFGGEIEDPIPYYTSGVVSPAFASCNKYGLNLDSNSAGPDKRGLGAELVNALMKKGMLIDIDHMSRKSFDETIELIKTKTPQYPVVASHVQSYDLHKMEFGGNAGRHERMRTREQLKSIRDSGGMIAAMTADDQQGSSNQGKKLHVPYATPLLGGVIDDDCRHSSKTFSQAYQYAVDIMGAPVAFGTDFNGVAGHVGPRYGNDACGGDLPFSVEASSAIERSTQLRYDKKLLYPFNSKYFGTFDKQVTGQKTFDFNVDGLAHVGLLPDMVNDMDNVGLNGNYLSALFNSAEEYVRVWERAKAISEGVAIPTPLDELSCSTEQADFKRTWLAKSEEKTDACTPDNVAPALTCSSNVARECTGPTTKVPFNKAKVVDACGVTTSPVCTAESNSYFGLGNTQVKCSATDTSNNQGSCAFLVGVRDTTPPAINCPADTVAECTSNNTAEVIPGLATGFDICSTSVSLTNHPKQKFNLGSETLIYTATDEQGLLASCNSKVTVQDTTKPNITAPANLAKVECTSPQGASPVIGQAAGTDSCDATVLITNNAPTIFPVRKTSEIVWTAIDHSNNVNTTKQLVEVVDTTPPAINCPADTVAECTSNNTAEVIPGLATGSDSCSTSVSLTNHPKQKFNLGTEALIYTATDEQGLLASCNSKVTVQDTTKPNITAPANLAKVECTSPQGASPAIGQATGTDSCDATVLITNNAPTIFPVRKTSEIVWTARDHSNNVNTTKQLVEVVDTTPPVINCPVDIIAECTSKQSATVTPGVATGSDSCSTLVELTTIGTKSFTLGTTALSYVATDAQGLTTSCASTVKIQDTTPPAITSVTASRKNLWPPNHKMKAVTISALATDACSVSAPVCKITEVSSNEPVQDKENKRAPDWKITGPLNVNLRAERNEKHKSRIYTVQVTCTDQQGLNTVGSTTVTVPRNNSDTEKLTRQK